MRKLSKCECGIPRKALVEWEGAAQFIEFICPKCGKPCNEQELLLTDEETEPKEV